MTSKKLGGSEALSFVNSHHIKDMEAVLSSSCSWRKLDGKILTGILEIKAMWADRWSVFPDFQVEIERISECDATQFVHARYFGSAGANKSIDMSFSTTVLLELETMENRISAVKEHGDPSKMREVEDRGRPIPGEELSRVSGFGGVFMKASDVKTLTAWYDSNLGTGFGTNSWSTFKWRERGNWARIGRTEFSMFGRDTDYFAPSASSFMFNFRVYNLEKMLLELSEKNVTIVGNTQVFEYGKFAWIMDPEGNKIELWEPIDQVLEDYDAG